MSPDADGLLRILETHGTELHALLTRLTLRAGVAEDLLQELFLKLRSSTGFHRAHDRKAYAFRTAMNLAFDWRRKQRLAGPLPIEPAATADSALDRLIHAEELEQVLDAMQKLPELSRSVVVLRHLQHHDYVEIANQLGKSEHQVRALYAKALGQAEEVVGVDLDEQAIGLAKQNANLNQAKIRFVQGDLFTWLRDILPSGQRFDVVILDPAKQTRDREEIDFALKRYYDMNKLALQAVAPGGIFLTCSCTGLVSEEMFVESLRRAAWQAGRVLQVLKIAGSPT